MIKIVNLSKIFDAGGKNEFVALSDINLSISQNLQEQLHSHL